MFDGGGTTSTVDQSSSAMNPHSNGTIPEFVPYSELFDPRNAAYLDIISPEPLTKNKKPDRSQPNDVELRIEEVGVLAEDPCLRCIKYCFNFPARYHCIVADSVDSSCGRCARFSSKDKPCEHVSIPVASINCH